MIPVSKARVALLAARFNSLVTEQLVQGARARLLAAGVAEDRISVARVPGAWELPQAARRLVLSRKHDAVVALGCVIRGATAHFDYVAGHASDGLGRVALEAMERDVAVVFGVLATENAEQARERADPQGADKGGEAAQAALDMIAFLGSC